MLPRLDMCRSILSLSRILYQMRHDQPLGQRWLESWGAVGRTKPKKKGRQYKRGLHKIGGSSYDWFQHHVFSLRQCITVGRIMEKYFAQSVSWCVTRQFNQRGLVSLFSCLRPVLVTNVLIIISKITFTWVPWCAFSIKIKWLASIGRGMTVHLGRVQLVHSDFYCWCWTFRRSVAVVLNSVIHGPKCS